MLPKHLIKSALKNQTSIGDNPCLPPEDENKFIVSLLDDYCDEILPSDNVDENELKEKLSELIIQCKKIERKYNNALEQICAECITELFQIPDDTVQIDCKLVNKVDTDSERLLPEKNNKYTFDSIEDIDILTGEIYKRRMLNALIAGASLYYARNFKPYFQKVFEINDELPSLYKKIMDINEILLYLSKDSLTKEGDNDGGKVDVYMSSNDEMIQINAEALLFPILLSELTKGILEIAVSHGLPEDREKAMYVIGKSDFKLAEIWDMRIGVPLWKLIVNRCEKLGYDVKEVGVNFLFMYFATMSVNEFNHNMKEVFAGTKKGMKILDNIIDEIIDGKEQDDFDEYMELKHSENIPINDEDYFNAEELITDSEEFFDADELVTDSEIIENKVFNNKKLILESNSSQAKKKSMPIIKELLGITDDSEAKNVLEQIKLAFYHNTPNDKEWVIFPSICRAALECGFGSDNVDYPKLNNLKELLVYMRANINANEMDPRDYQNTDYKTLDDIIGKMISKADDEEAERVNNTEYVPNDEYEIIGPIDFETAKKYGDDSCPSSKLCYTQNEKTWNEYTINGMNTVYVILKRGWQNIPAQHDNEHKSPYDTYGLSMIFVFVNEHNKLVYCNVRWNHDANYGAKQVDHAMDKIEISQLIGRNFNEVFKPINSFANAVKTAQEKLKHGENIADAFDKVLFVKNHFELYVVILHKKYNLYNIEDNKLLCNHWYDFISNFAYDDEYFTNVLWAKDDAENKQYLLNFDGRPMIRASRFYSDTYCSNVLRVEFNPKRWCLINSECKRIGNLFYKYISDFDKNKNCAVQSSANGYWNVMNDKGELLSDRWFMHENNALAFRDSF